MSSRGDFSIGFGLGVLCEGILMGALYHVRWTLAAGPIIFGALWLLRGVVQMYRPARAGKR